MIEIVYKEDKKQAKGNESFFRLPNNIRQIGECKGKQKIYMEDFVYTFLRRFAEENPQERKVAILLGKCNWTDGITYRFIRSALSVSDMEVSEEHVNFTDKVWKQVQEDMDQYFPEQEILGWFMSIPELPEEVTEVVLRAHLNHFAGNDKVLFMMEPVEKEEAFYTYEGGKLKKEKGFYIYYEKNEPMQNYMVEHNPNRSVENEQVPDRAVKDFRKIITESSDADRKTAGTKKILYGLGSCAVLAAVVFGVSSFDSYEDLKLAVGNFTGLNSETKEKTEASAEFGKNNIITEKEVTGQIVTQAPQPQDTQELKEDVKEEVKEQNNSADNNEDDEITDPEQTISGDDQEEQKKSTEQDGTQQTTAEIHREYTIQKGDTISKISERFYGSTRKVGEICNLNQLNPEDIIYVGQKILLP